mgnify:CR=1 FL=1
MEPIKQLKRCLNKKVLERRPKEEGKMKEEIKYTENGLPVVSEATAQVYLDLLSNIMKE